MLKNCLLPFPVKIFGSLECCLTLFFHNKKKANKTKIVDACASLNKKEFNAMLYFSLLNKCFCKCQSDVCLQICQI